MSARHLGDKARAIVDFLNRMNELDMEASARLFRAIGAQDWDTVLEVATELMQRNQVAWSAGIYLYANELQAADDRVMEETAKQRKLAQK